MSNLNDDDEQARYGEEHEHSDGGAPQGDGAGVAHGHDADQSGPALGSALGPGADFSGMGNDGPSDGVGVQGLGPGYQQELPGFQHAAIQVARVAPLPDPGELAGYDHVSPGAAEMILRVYQRNAQVTADATERNSIAEAGAVERNSKAESLALKVFAAGYVALPVATLVTGVALALAEIGGGVITAVIGGVAVLAESLGRALGGRKKVDGSSSEPG